MLRAALVFSRNAIWRPWYGMFALFPVVWGGVAVNGLDRFLLVALPIVLFRSGATLWTVFPPLVGCSGLLHRVPSLCIIPSRRWPLCAYSTGS